MREPVGWPGDPPLDPAGVPRWRELGLTDEEFERILAGLGRLPTWCELGMFSVAWSEHCAYKHSRLALRRLPTSGGRLLVGPGENAGVLDIGDGWALAVRLESHNHPSFVEPYQGAATGVGGIVRDVLAAGARPVALLDALRFGPLERHPRNRYLFEEVVAGIAGYGNAIGVPTVGGEVAFDPAYDTNPLVNVMCVGLVRRDRIARARAAGPGNPVYLVGSRTGRDGIHGAGLLASRTFSDDPQQALRPRVQVGDPFMEKLLIEACLEALQTGAVVGIQDLGAAGITAAASELAARGGTGMAIDLDAVPCREPGMTPFEVLLSESQERMMLVVERARAGEVEAVLNRWKLPWACIGTVTEDGRLRFWMGGRLVADVPAALLAEGAPRYEAPAPTRPVAFGPHRAAGRRPEPGHMGGARPQEASALGRRLREHLASPAEGWRGWIYTQFDYMVGLRTVLPPGHDAAVLRIPENGRYVALSLDGAPRLARRCAYLAAAAAVLEGARNVAAVGADPIGITNGINLGNPQRPEVMQQLADCVEGMADACRALGIPVTGGNVSLYNETGDRSIPPTVIVGMVGLLEGPGPVPSGFQRPGDEVVLIGEPEPLDGWETEAPLPDFEAQRRAIALVAQAGREGLLASCHDVGDGGLAVALAECALVASEGADGVRVRLELGPEEDAAAALFEKGGACWVASVRPGRLHELRLRARQAGVTVRLLGTVQPGRICVQQASSGEAVLDEPTDELRGIWQAAFERKADRAQRFGGPGPGLVAEAVLTAVPEAREECGVVGVYGDPQAAALARWALLALQHRGQESAGIATLDADGRLHVHKGMGLVAQALGTGALQRLVGHAAVGHVRYSTTGASRLENAQPIVSRFRGGFLALAHNGNLVNAAALREELESEGAIFQTTTDSEVVAHLAARFGAPGESSVAYALSRIAGAWALVFLDAEGLLAARDPLGIRPLCLGVAEAETGEKVWVVASESCALDAVGASLIREVEPGELLRIDARGPRTVARLSVPATWATGHDGGLCAFEAIYLARPDSVLFGQSVHGLRKETGRRLAREHPAPADLVTGVPDSSLSAAMGYAEELGLPFEMGLVPNRYIGRTFIQPGQSRRRAAVSAKLNAVRKVVEGRRVVLVDDSIVRGTTARHIVRMLRQAGAAQVHVRIASPPYRFPCHYGVDTARREELVGARLDVEGIQQAIGADSLAFLSVEGLLAVLGSGSAVRPCLACFTGAYPIRVDAAADKLALEVPAKRPAAGSG